MEFGEHILYDFTLNKIIKIFTTSQEIEPLNSSRNKFIVMSSWDNEPGSPPPDRVDRFRREGTDDHGNEMQQDELRDHNRQNCRRTNRRFPGRRDQMFGGSGGSGGGMGGPNGNSRNHSYHNPMNNMHHNRPVDSFGQMPPHYPPHAQPHYMMNDPMVMGDVPMAPRAMTPIEVPMYEENPSRCLAFLEFVSAKRRKNELHSMDPINDQNVKDEYNKYVQEHKKSLLAKYFVEHNKEEWFKLKYHPNFHAKYEENITSRVKRRFEIFLKMDKLKLFDQFSLTENDNCSNSKKLERLMDAFLIFLEGGMKFDLKSLGKLEIIEKRNCKKRSAPTSDAMKKRKMTEEESESPDANENGDDNKLEEEGELEDDIDEEENGELEKIEVKILIEDTISKLCEKEEPTRSIFFRKIPEKLENNQLEEACEKYKGFLRIFIADPTGKNLTKRGWATYSNNSEVLQYCYKMEQEKVGGYMIGAMVNRGYGNSRIKFENYLSSHRFIVKMHLKIIVTLIKNYDRQYNLWDSQNEDDQMDEATSSEEQRYDSDEGTDKSIEKKKSRIEPNPFLRNIEQYLVEEVNAEATEINQLNDEDEDDDELNNNETNEDNWLKEYKNFINDTQFEIDDKLNVVLDKLILYIRFVHSINFYDATKYTNEDMMPHRCSIMHLRNMNPKPPGIDNIATKEDVTNYLTQFYKKIKQLQSFQRKLCEDEALEFGLKNEQDEIDKMIEQHTIKLKEDRYECQLSGKKFKAKEFVQKHIYNKHSDKIDDVRNEVLFFNNYLYDKNRPMYPTPSQPHNNEMGIMNNMGVMNPAGMPHYFNRQTGPRMFIPGRNMNSRSRRTFSHDGGGHRKPIPSYNDLDNVDG
ncbi:hypothetical protein SNEBB_005232 [Seison nebaliae]|nr:hypothetical protein SNEBB_005232 [Seison nebaliae]